MIGPIFCRWTLALLLATPSVHAAEPASPAIDAARASALYPVLQEAYTLYRNGHFDAAVVAFERAYAISPEPRFILNIAVSHRDIGRCGRALADFDRFFSLCTDCPQLEAARGVLNDTRRQCTPLITIHTRPVSALITVDDEPQGSAPIKVELGVGPHVVQASAAGFESTERAIVVQPKTPATVRIDLSELAPAPQIAQPEIAQPEIAQPEAPPSASPTATNSWAWAAFTVAGVGAITGGIWGLRLLDDLDRETNARSRSEKNNAQADARRDASIAQVGLGVAIVSAAAGITLLMTDDETVKLQAAGGGAMVFMKF